MAKEDYILKHQGNPIAIISASSEAELKKKTGLAIRNEVSAEPNTQFELKLGRVGDWGEDTSIKTSYVQDGLFITDGEFSLMKTISY
jgi:hypothetical protein